MSFVVAEHQIFCTHQIDTYCGAVVYIVPKVFTILLHLFLGKIVKEKLPLLFLNTKHDCSALAIGKGRIRVPKVSGESPCCTFEFQVITLILNEQ